MNIWGLKIGCIIVGLICALSAMAGTMGVIPGERHPSWSATGSMGYTNYQNMFQNDGKAALGRLALGRELFILSGAAFGLELGLQSGNNMRLDIPESTLDQLGGLFIQSTMKPMLDLLATLQTSQFGSSPIFAIFKGGVVYRTWQFNDRVDTLSDLVGEVQAGLGFPVSQAINLTLLYQGIFGGTPNFTITTECPLGEINTSPIQQGVLLSLTYVF